jgi:sugar lactone lactonase YvrE
MQTRASLFLIMQLLAAAITACSGPSSNGVPVQQSTQGRHLTMSARADIRFGLLDSTLRRALASRSSGFYTPATRKSVTLYVSDLQAEAVELFAAYEGNNPPESGTITQGIDNPTNIAIDKSGTLYVAYNGNNTVTEYPLGATSPSITLSNELVDPNGIAVDSKGTVYVTSGSSVGSCYVLEFPKGSSTPSVQVNGFDLPIGLAIDKNDNLYVGDASANKVYEVPKGTTTPENLNLSELGDPTGLAFDREQNLWVSNDEPQYEGSYIVFAVHGFKLGQTAPFATIQNHCSYFGCGQGYLDGPYAIGIDARDTLYAGNSFNFPGDVTSYKRPSHKQKLFETFSQDIQVPAGVAIYPPARP